jgi:hypothetical protein
MAVRGHVPEALRARLDLLEDPANQGDDFKKSTWLWLTFSGLILPLTLMLWGLT